LGGVQAVLSSPICDFVRLLQLDVRVSLDATVTYDPHGCIGQI